MFTLLFGHLVPQDGVVALEKVIRVCRHVGWSVFEDAADKCPENSIELGVGADVLFIFNADAHLHHNFVSSSVEGGACVYLGLVERRNLLVAEHIHVAVVSLRFCHGRFHSRKRRVGSKPTPKTRGMEAKDLFARLAADDKASSQSEAEADDSFLVVAGPKNSGKSSLVLYFLNPNKGTFALFTWTSLISPSSNKKAVAHIWELATTKKVLELLKVPLSPARLPKATLLLVLDLSIPGDVVPSLIYWVNLLRKLTPEGPKDENALLAKYGATHPDRRDVSPVALPLLIVGAKYETFRDEESAKRKTLVQAVRFIAHAIGATLMFTSVKDKALATQFRTTLTAMLYKTDGGKSTKELEKGLFVPAGSDSFDDIGLPKGARATDFEDANLDKRMKLWAKAVAESYPPVTPEVKEQVEDEKDEADEKFPEPVIDALRKQKREELRRYKEKKVDKKPKKDAKE
ncbi:Aste57867_10150 [Aphanomyces stellatus]|uniref:Cytoplasmic dynein 2 light intermediate chain 1 n=1 Tax=Aphanomyces stellatus TaxID=120398 RepID=A0A485KQ56_9STRA|nr:hypothetical protein As57867_010111 [Aphanomyces stellatus]VFT87026.1 Aste57867_10150 [Aphanomyces stellatus]